MKITVSSLGGSQLAKTVAAAKIENTTFNDEATANQYFTCDVNHGHLRLVSTSFTNDFLRHNETILFNLCKTFVAITLFSKSLARFFILDLTAFLQGQKLVRTRMNKSNQIRSQVANSSFRYSSVATLNMFFRVAVVGPGGIIIPEVDRLRHLIPDGTITVMCLTWNVASRVIKI